MLWHPLYDLAAELYRLVVIPVPCAATPRRRAATPVHHRGCEWYWRVRKAIAHPWLVSVGAAVLLVVGVSPENASGVLPVMNSACCRVKDTVMTVIKSLMIA